MARKRMIDPDFWTDEALGTASIMARLLFMGCISQSDDEGRLRGNPALLRSNIFPYDESLTAADVESELDVLDGRGLIQRYVVDGEQYIWIVNFDKHQTINKPTPSKLPEPPIHHEIEQLPDDSGSPTGDIPPNRREKKGSKEKRSEDKTLAPKPARERNPTWDALSDISTEPETKSERSDFAKTVRELEQARASPRQIGDFALWWHRTFPDAQLTHRCYRRHWGKFINAPPPKPATVEELKNPMMRALIRFGERHRASTSQDNAEQNGRVDRNDAETYRLGSGVGLDNRDILPGAADCS